MTIPLQGLDFWESQGEGRMEGYVGAADPEARRSDSLSGEGSVQIWGLTLAHSPHTHPSL